MKGILLIIVATSCFIFSGCAKMLQPGSETDFSCSNKVDGVCADIHDVYENRKNIDALKRKIKLEKMGEKSDYISKRCGLYQVSGLQTAGTDYETCASMAESEYEETLAGLVNDEYQRASLAVNKFGGGTTDIIDIETGIAKREPDRVHKIWIAPYTNDAGDLVGGHYVFTVTKPSGWSVKVNKVHSEQEVDSIPSSVSDKTHTTSKLQDPVKKEKHADSSKQATTSKFPQKAQELIKGLNLGNVRMENE